MSKAFTINGKTYFAQEFSYNTICELQDYGIDIETMGDKGASMVRAFFSIWSGLPLKDAGNELGLHMMSGGTLDELGAVINESLESSDFFRAITKADQKSPQKSRSKKTEKEE